MKLMLRDLKAVNQSILNAPRINMSGQKWLTTFCLMTAFLLGVITQVNADCPTGTNITTTWALATNGDATNGSNTDITGSPATGGSAMTISWTGGYTRMKKTSGSWGDYVATEAYNIPFTLVAGKDATITSFTFASLKSSSGTAATGYKLSYSIDGGSNFVDIAEVAGGAGPFTNLTFTPASPINLSAGVSSLNVIVRLGAKGTSSNSRNLDFNGFSITGKTCTPTVCTPPATPTASNNGPVCAGSSLTLSTPTVSGATYAWTGPNSFTSSAQNPTVSSSATAAMAGTYSVTVTVSGCTSAAGTTSVTVNPKPATPTASNNGPVCVGSALSLSTATVAGATYAWTGPNSFSSSAQNPSVSSSATAAMAGVYSLTETVSGCTSAAGTTTVVVNSVAATPSASNNGPVCAGTTLSLSTPTVSGVSYSWTGPNGFSSSSQNPTVSASATAAMAGTYSLTETTVGCAASTAGTTIVVVNPSPTTPSASNNGPVCAGTTLSLSTATVAGATYAWTGPNGFSSSAQNPTVSSNATTAMSGTYSLTETVSGCTSAAGTTSATVTPLAAITLTSPAATENQSVGVNTPIANITYSLSGSATSATVTWTGTANSSTPPAGISVVISAPNITISGSPSSLGNYGYTILTNGCTPATDGGTIAATLSSAKDITAFTISGQVGGSTIGSNTIAVTMPAGTMRYGLAPNLITVSANASVSPAVNVPQDFRSPVQYTVTAQDNSIKVYTVTVSLAPGSCNFTYFQPDATHYDLGSGNSPRYYWEVAGVAKLMRNATGSSDYTETTVTSCEGTTTGLTMGSGIFAFQTYNQISSFTVYGVGTGSGRTLSGLKVGTTTSNYASVTATAGNGTDNDIDAVCEFLTITPTNPIAANSYVEVTFSGNVNIVKVVFTGNVCAIPKLSTPTIPAVNYATAVTSQGFTAHWNDVSNEIGYTLKVYDGSNVLQATVNGIAANATSVAVTGLLANTNYTFKVTAIGDGDAYNDSDPSAASAAIRTLSTEKDITSFIIASVPASIIGTSITATLPYGTDATALTPTVAVSANATYGPTGAQNFTSPVDYTVTAEDGSTKVYNATISVSTTPPGPVLSAAPGQTVAAPFTITFTDNQAWRAAVTGYQVDGGSIIPVGTPGSSLTSGVLTFNPANITALRLPQSHTVIVYATGFENSSVTQTTIAGPATHITVTNVAAPATNGGALATQPVVTFKDLYENVAASTATVNATATSGSWVIGGTASKNAIAGLASFTNLTAATSDGNALALATITFTSGAFTVASNTFTIPPYQTAPGDYFRTITSGDWNATDPATVWQSSPNGSNWFAATAAPSSASGTITISPNTQVTIASGVTVDELIVAADAELVVNSGVIFTVADGTGTDVIVNGLFTNKNTSGTPITFQSTSATMNIASGGTYKMDAVNGTIPNISATFSYSTGSTLYVGKTPERTTSAGRIPSTGSPNYNFPGSVVWDDNNSPSNSNNLINGSNNAVQISGDFIMKNGLAMAGNGSTPRTLTVLGNIIVEGGQLAAKADFGSGNGGGDFSIICAGNVTVTGGAFYLVGSGANPGGGGFMTIGGNLSNTGGNFGMNNAGSTGTISMTSSSARTLQTTGQVTNGTTQFILNNTGGGLTLLSNFAVNGNVTLTNGKINTGANKLSVADNSTINATSDKYINGRLERVVANGTTSKTFEIGDAANYLPVIIDFVGGTSVQGSLTVSTTPEEHDDIINSGIKPDHSVNRYFTVTNNGVGLKAAGYNITLPYADADKDFLADEAKFKVAKYDGVAWVAPASSTPNAGSNTTIGNGFTSFSEFVIGEGTTTTTSITNVVATYGDDVVTLTSGIIPPQAIGLVHFFVDGLEVGTGMNVGGTATLQLDPSGFAVGPHVIYATFVADGGYESSISANGNLTIQPKELIPVITVANKLYDAGVTADATLVELTGKETGDDVSGSITSAEFDDANVADNKNVTVYLSISGADVANYTVGNPVYKTANITPASATISVTGYSGTYDGNAHGASATISGVAGEDLNASLDLGNSYTDASGGSANWTFSNGNYYSQSGSVAIVIGKANATVTITGYSGTYDGTAHGATGSATGVVGVGEDLSSSLDLGASFTDATGGTAHWTFAGGTNYNDQSGNVAIEIGKADATVTVNGYSGIYDGAAHGATGSATGVVGVGEDLSSSLDLGASFTDATGGTAHWVFTGGANYNDQSGDVAIEIEKADATVNVTGYSGTYDGTAHGATGSAKGVVGAGEDLSLGLDLGASFTNATGGTAHWTFNGGTNYYDQSGDVVIEIGKADAIVSVSGYTGTYDGAAHGATGSVTGVGADPNAAGTSLNFGSSFTDVPGGVAHWTLTGGSNYNDQDGDVTIVINKAAATVSVVGYTGIYDGNAHGATGSATGLGGIDLSAGLSLGNSFTNAPGGTANWTFGGGTNYADQSGSVAIVINDCLPIDASASGMPVKLGTDAILSATVSPATAGISVKFYLDDVFKGSCTTNAAGTASITVSGLGVDVYKVKAVAGAGCPESIAYLPVYDPSGGFITGGGWIMSPAGAYAADKSLTGKANFGFNAKYKKGSNAVDGNTEFQFQAGNLNFKSTQHDAGTLVIATFKGIFKGIGTINGEAGYSFMVSAIDGQINGGGGVDKFRIKIWNTLTSATVYDNGVDPLTGNYLDANAAPTTALGGGSIVIQEAKTNSKAAQRIDPDVLVTSLDARVFNNPAAGASSFRLKLLSPDAEHPINVKVVDMTGKSLQAVQSTAGQTVEFGATFRSGMYIAEISQNGQRKLVKLVKQ